VCLGGISSRLTFHVVYAQVDELYSVLVSQFQLFVAFRAFISLEPRSTHFSIYNLPKVSLKDLAATNGLPNEVWQSIYLISALCLSIILHSHQSSAPNVR